MKVSVKIYREVEIKYLQVEAQVRYWDDAEDGEYIPCKDGELWKPLIDFDKGQIINWQQGKVASVHYKVCDAGSYYLLDPEKNILLSIHNDYVPSILSPEDSGYGDYIIMEIDEDGFIRDWKADISDFTQDEWSVIK